MHKLPALFVALFLIASVPVFAASPVPGAAQAQVKTVTLKVENMTCPLCPITVKKALTKVPGVLEAQVDFDHKTATVRYDPSKTDVAALTKATTDAGYPSRPERDRP